MKGLQMKFIKKTENIHLVSRRDLYLSLWGGVYLVMGSYLAFGHSIYRWSVAFWLAGSLAIIGALYNSPRKKGIAFGMLVGVALFRSIAYIVPDIFSVVDMGSAVGPSLLYFGIAASHYTVSGWKDEQIIETSKTPEDKER